MGADVSIRPASRWRQFLLGVMLLGLALGVALWIAVHRVPWMGPLVADSLRAVIGRDAVARLEELAYGAEDQYNRLARRGQAPKAYWQVSSASTTLPAAVVSAKKPTNGLIRFRPEDVGPVHSSWSAPGDGSWVPIVDPRAPSADPVLYKVLLHPDPNRSWAELFVVAVDLRSVAVKMVLGYQEPTATTPAGLEKLRHRTPARPSVVPVEDRGALLGVFNGGFKTEHGAYGVMIDQVTLVPPRERACAFALLGDGSLRVGSWDRLAPVLSEMIWYRQTPSCMAQDGKLHPGLANPNALSWGATLDGETVIRRSAVGIDRTGRVLLVGITNSTTARALALGMLHAGAAQIAQLDVNWSFPRFVLFEPSGQGDEIKAKPLAPGFELDEADYTRKRAMRDFFYLVRKPASS